MKLKICILIFVTIALAIFFGIKINRALKINPQNINQKSFIEGSVTASDGAILHWWKFDRKTPITTYVLHGGPEGQSKWMIEYGNELADILGTVVFYDRRGCGASSQNVLEDSMTYDVAVTDLKLVIDHTSLPDSPFILLGHSFGGTLAVHFAPFFKNQLKGIILSSPFLNMTAEIKGRQAVSGQKCSELSMADADEVECADGVAEGWSRNEHYLLKDHLLELSTINVPTLFVSGSCDGLANSVVVTVAKKALPSIEAITIQGGSHRVFFNKTSSISGVLKDFIQNIK